MKKSTHHKTLSHVSSVTNQVKAFAYCKNTIAIPGYPLDYTVDDGRKFWERKKISIFFLFLHRTPTLPKCLKNHPPQNCLENRVCQKIHQKILNNPSISGSFHFIKSHSLLVLDRTYVRIRTKHTWMEKYVFTIY